MTPGVHTRRPSRSASHHRPTYRSRASGDKAQISSEVKNSGLMVRMRAISVSFACVFLGLFEETAFARDDSLEFGAADQPVAEAEAAAQRRGLDVNTEAALAQEDRVVEMPAVERAFAVDDFAAEPSGAPDQEALDHDCGYCVYRKYMSRIMLRYTHCCGSRNAGTLDVWISSGLPNNSTGRVSARRVSRAPSERTPPPSTAC